jgi:hypothetical protein
MTCPCCGEPDASVFSVSYDAMVDGAGCEESEERCEACANEAAAERASAAADEDYYGGDSPGFYGPDDPGPGGW